MVRENIRKYIAKTIPAGEIFSVDFQEKDPQKFGHYATNAALLSAKKEGKNPLETAERIAEALRKEKDFFARVEVAPPGFVNMWLSPSVLFGAVTEARGLEGAYGRNDSGAGKKARVEYVSANPTGPLHVGNARGGPIGEALAKALELSGYTVLREYIHNDAGNQVEKMGETVFYWCEKLQGRESAFPEGGYAGEYLSEVAGAFLKHSGGKATRDDLHAMTDFALRYIYAENIETLKRMGIAFDYVVKESELISSGKTEQALAELDSRGVLKEKEGAVWFQPNDEFLEDRETVVRRSNGKPTYFASDIAYHKDKFSSGYDLVIDVFGSNHHGHVPKLQALTKIFNFPSERFFVLLYQYVRLKRGSEVVKMAKRAGTYVTAKEVLDEVGADNMVFSFLLNSPNTHIDFDLEGVKAESMKNPVYYVQYAAVRAGSILQKAKAEGVIPLENFTNLTTPEDEFLIRKVAEYPEVIFDTARDFEVQRLTRFAVDLARGFHSFYEKERIVGEPAEIAGERMALVAGVLQVLKNVLATIGISAPDKM